MRIAYPVIFTDIGTNILIEVPDLNILTEANEQGDRKASISDAIKMARDVIGLNCICYEDDKMDLPEATELKEIDIKEGTFSNRGISFVSLVDVDLTEYRRKIGMYDNFFLTFDNLKNVYGYKEPFDVVIEAGLVGLYRFCFDASLKLLKEVLSDHGYEESATGSPKTILKTAYSAGMIDDEDKWLKALAARNNVSHAYNREIAADIIKETKDIFYDMFADLKAEIEKWI